MHNIRDIPPQRSGPLPSQSSAASQAECYLERGIIYQKRKDYRRACREMKQAIALETNSHQVWGGVGGVSRCGDVRSALIAGVDFVRGVQNLSGPRRLLLDQ